MSYSPTIDFISLLRQTPNGVRTERMPGLDYIVAAMARMGLFTLFVGQTPPIVNQATTVWLKPSLPSWVAEGSLFLWNPITSEYELATPALWNAVLAPSGYLFQAATDPTNVINAGVSLLAVERVAPVGTALVLPSLTAQWLTGRPLRVVDWSTTVTAHTITLTPPDGATIMRQASWELLSTAVQLAGITLYASPELNGWVIAP